MWSCRAKATQVIACKGSHAVGSVLQIRRPTTILRVKFIKMGLQRGSAREVSLPSGAPRVPYCGSTANVRVPCQYRDNLNSCPYCSGFRENYSDVRGV